MAIYVGLNTEYPVTLLDLYKLRAAELFGVPYSQVTREQRAEAKRQTLMQMYSAGFAATRSRLERYNCKPHVEVIHLSGEDIDKRVLAMIEEKNKIVKTLMEKTDQ